MGHSDIAKPETAEPRYRLSRARCRLVEMSLQEASFAEGTPRPGQVEKRAHSVGQPMASSKRSTAGRYCSSSSSRTASEFRKIVRIVRSPGPEQVGSHVLPERSFLRGRRYHDAQGSEREPSEPLAPHTPSHLRGFSGAQCRFVMVSERLRHPGQVHRRP